MYLKENRITIISTGPDENEKILEFFAGLPEYYAADLDEEYLEEDDVSYEDLEMLEEVIDLSIKKFGPTFYEDVHPDDLLEYLEEAAQGAIKRFLNRQLARLAKVGLKQSMGGQARIPGKNRISRFAGSAKGTQYKKGIAGWIGKTARGLQQKMVGKVKGSGYKSGSQQRAIAGYKKQQAKKAAGSGYLGSKGPSPADIPDPKPKAPEKPKKSYVKRPRKTSTGGGIYT